METDYAISEQHTHNTTSYCNGSDSRVKQNQVILQITNKDKEQNSNRR